MKTMKIEKELQFADQVKEPRSLQIRESLEYQKEAEGIRAVGPLTVQGSYINEEGALQEYQEILEMDVLAPNHKLSQDRFYLDIQEYQAVPADNGLHLTILMGIHGLQEQAKAAPQTYTEVQYEEDAYIMFGKESGGIPEEILLENQETAIRIPMMNDIRSLNLSNSVAIVLYEALRQHNFDHMQLGGHLTRYEWK